MSVNGWVTEIEINAPQQFIWNHLVDFAAYQNWNPFMLEAQADFKVGASIHFLEDLQDFGQHWITAKFVSIQEPNQFVWQGSVYAAFLFEVRHSFVLQPMHAERTRFIHSHHHTGLLLPYLAHRGVFQRSKQGYLLFNEALKQRCENHFRVLSKP